MGLLFIVTHLTVLICAVLTANLCSCNLLQCNATFQNFLCVSPLKISPKADRLLACAVPANFHYVNALLVPTSPLKRTVITERGVAKNVNWGPPLPFNGGITPQEIFLKLKVLVGFRAFWASKLTPLLTRFFEENFENFN